MKMRAACILLILMMPLSAQATNRYVGASATGAGNGTTVNDLCGGLADTDCTPVADDLIYLCGTFTTQILPQSVQGTSGHPITYDFNCPGNPGSLVFDGSADQGVYLNARAWHVWNNIRASGPNGTGGSTEKGLIVLNGAAQVVLNNPTVHDNTEAVHGHGIRVKTSTDITINNPIAYNNIGHGVVIVNNSARVSVIGTNGGCQAYNNRRTGFMAQGATAQANLDTITFQGCEAYGNGDGFYTIIAQNVNFINNLSHDNTNILNGAAEGYGIAVEKTLNARVEGNTIYRNRTNGVEIWADTSMSSSNCLVRRNIIWGHTLFTANDSGSNGFKDSTGYAQNCRIIGNLIYNNTRNFRIGNDPGGTTLMANNTAYGGDMSVKVVDSNEAGTNAMTGWTIENNIFANPAINWFFTEVTSGNSNTFAKNSWVGAGMKSTYNNVDYTASTISTVDSTAITADPVFISSTDYRLQASSPLRRMGVFYHGCIDVRGRICNSPPDIGAYQMTSGDPAGTRLPRN